MRQIAIRTGKSSRELISTKLDTKNLIMREIIVCSRRFSRGDNMSMHWLETDFAQMRRHKFYSLTKAKHDVMGNRGAALMANIFEANIHYFKNLEKYDVLNIVYKWTVAFLVIETYLRVEDVYMYVMAGHRFLSLYKMKTIINCFLWWHISAITCQIIMSTCQKIMSTCQIFMLTCQIIMSTCQKIIITINRLISCFHSFSCP